MGSSDWAALLDLLMQPVAGLVHLDSNAVEGHRFAAIVRALRERLGRSEWQVSVHADCRHDQRLAGGEWRMPGLSARLPALSQRLINTLPNTAGSVSVRRVPSAFFVAPVNASRNAAFASAAGTVTLTVRATAALFVAVIAQLAPS